MFEKRSDLKKFLAVAGIGTVVGAADRIAMTQPACRAPSPGSRRLLAERLRAEDREEGFGSVSVVSLGDIFARLHFLSSFGPEISGRILRRQNT